MHFGRGKPLVCPVCGDHHRIEHCRVGEDEPAPLTPLETPSHSGPYQGPVPVRVLPAGLSGEEHPGRLVPVWKDKAKRGRVVQSRAALQRTHCKRGHELTPENTYYYRKLKGDEREYPRCRQCMLDNSRQRKQARNARRATARAAAPPTI